MGEDAAEAWPIALEKIAAATGEPSAHAGRFLDSALGLNFAATVEQFLRRGRTMPEAIDESVTHWMTKRADEAVFGIQVMPDELPYLTTFVRYCGMLPDLPKI